MLPLLREVYASRRGPLNRWAKRSHNARSKGEPIEQPARMLTGSSPDASFVIGSVRKDSSRECGASVSADYSAAAPATVGG
jgi:hypothetical protein